MSTTTIERSTGSAPSAGRHRVTVREADDRHGRFEILLPDGATLPASRTPLLAAARYLLSEGVNPSAVVEMRHASRPDVVAAFGKVGALAKLDVREDQTSGPRFCRWRPPPQDRA
ncbi:hypothetical protein [Bradyrhizobium ottawaense]|uniref:hypothetical protein n=1 Tax=Bradyrhizobium ottawaense TaxID=931866 RepID=UPI001BAC2CDF|nr:hypothetical protein [Bradyrhizobium ottawaense]MBR1325732.1 hypothetical protein [Bradyrhizobium ottawaense]